MGVDGRWSVTLDTPMGSQEVELELTADGATLTGKMESHVSNAEITEGTIDGDRVSWTAKVTSPVKATLKFSGTVDGDTMSGKTKIGPMPGGSFTGRRLG